MIPLTHLTEQEILNLSTMVNSGLHSFNISNDMLKRLIGEILTLRSKNYTEQYLLDQMSKAILSERARVMEEVNKLMAPLRKA